MNRTFRRSAALLVMAIAVGGCDSGTNRHTSAPTTTPSTGPTTTLPPDLVFVAQAKGDKIPVFKAPEDPAPASELSNPDEVGTARVFLVKAQRGQWYDVVLPVRPPGTRGWIRGADIQAVTDHDFKVQIALGAHQITLFKAAQPFLQEPVGVGPDAPPPSPDYFISDVAKSPNPKGPYGPAAYGLSGFADKLKAGAVVGVHGTNEPSSIGKDVKAGSIRMSSKGLEQLATLPLGTPVIVLP